MYLLICQDIFYLFVFFVVPRVSCILGRHPYTKLYLSLSVIMYMMCVCVIVSAYVCIYGVYVSMYVCIYGVCVGI